MKYDDIRRGTFIERPNRFIAHVEVEGRTERVHVKNTGRCRELLVPGAVVYLEDHINRMGTRKLRYSLIAAEKHTLAGRLMVNMDSQAPNKVVKEALEEGLLLPRGLSDMDFLKTEYAYGNSRLDFYGKDSRGRQWLAEVKGVTLEEDGTARFPDAPTERGIKHLKELTAAVAAGYGASVIFIIQMKGVHTFEPNDAAHPQFGETLRKAKRAGVELIACDCIVEKDALFIDQRVPVKLEK